MLRRQAHPGSTVTASSFTPRMPCSTVWALVAAIHVRHRQPVVEKAEMKFAFFEHAADVPVKIRRPARSLREAGWRQELRKVGAFCACRKPTKIIWRVAGSLTAPERRFLPLQGEDRSGVRGLDDCVWERQLAAGEAGCDACYISCRPAPALPLQGEEKCNA